MKALIHHCNDGTDIEVGIEHKCVKVLRLRLRRDGTFALSVPHGVSLDGARAFVADSEKWMRQCLAHREQQRLRTAAGQIAYLGQVCKRALWKKSDSRTLLVRDGDLLVCSPHPGSFRETFTSIWKERLLDLAGSYTRTWSGRICLPDRGERIENKVRKMRASWGRCDVGGRKVTYSFYLLCAPPGGIEYVVLHELLHFQYPDHGKRFKEALSSHMPDWRLREKSMRDVWASYIGCW